jgi:hypothetical protein
VRAIGIVIGTRTRPKMRVSIDMVTDAVLPLTLGGTTACSPRIVATAAAFR